jgi:hypothetical protein
MKHLFSLAILGGLLSVQAIAQNGIPMPGTAQYDLMKRNGTLPEQVIQHGVLSTARTAQANAPLMPSVLSTTTNSNCGCLVPLDSTFQVVPFLNGSGPLFVNDDGSSARMALPFTFCYYGSQVDSFYINNNGNISFSGPYSTFTSYSFPSGLFNMIAPFWGDVDTRGSGMQIVPDSMGGYDTIPGTPNLGAVYYKMTPTAVIIKWEEVGYFSTQGDKRNTFQLIITDGNDPLVPGGNNVAFCYGDMQWTTGYASGGQNGFGGTPATVGINKGDSVNFFQLGRFDHAGTDYDGPAGVNDGISYLDNSAYYFTTCSQVNIPPIALTNLCDSVFLNEGDSAEFVYMFIGPENNQMVTLALTTADPNYQIVSNTPGNPAVMVVQYLATANRSSSDIQVVATDNGSPVATTTTNTHVTVTPLITGIKQTGGAELSLQPNPSNGMVLLNLGKAGNGQVRVLNLAGQVIQQHNVQNQSQLSLDLTAQPRGVYFVELRTQDKTITRKLVRE